MSEKKEKLPLFKEKYQGKGELIISSKLRQQVKYLHDNHPGLEWCGILMYKILEGDIMNPDNLILQVDYIYPLGLGTHSFTEAEYGKVLNDLVDIEEFRYPGPSPQSKETAILMLADACEARLRAERPESRDGLRNIIKEVVDNRLGSGQLDNTNLTLRDLDEIVDSFTTTLRGIFHPRIEYPKLDQQEKTSVDPTPTKPLLSKPASDISAEPQIDS